MRLLPQLQGCELYSYWNWGRIVQPETDESGWFWLLAPFGGASLGDSHPGRMMVDNWRRYLNANFES